MMKVVLIIGGLVAVSLALISVVGGMMLAASINTSIG